MSVLIVIPARYASKRFPGKPLAPLRGADGVAKPLIRWTWEAALQVSGAPRVVVATDDDRIAIAAQGFGAEVSMTSPDCANGTERCADVLNALPEAEVPQLVVNLQGDAPLTPPWFVEALVAAMRADPDAGMATPILRCDGASLAALRHDRAQGRVGGTTAVTDRAGDALYFSKEVLPFAAVSPAPDAPSPVFHHVGVYAYRPAALALYGGLRPGPLEALEGLEQLRFLEHGHKVKCVEVEARGRHFWELNNPEDVAILERALSSA